MKQYTTTEQTAKLIELGFEKPKNRLVKQRFDRSTSSWIVVGEEGDYSIGELIEILPEEINKDTLPGTFRVYIDHNKMWAVDYSNILGAIYSICHTELIDALYEMIIKLKESEVI